MDVRQVLLRHHKRYPKMQIQDMVKLIYQSEFGGDYLINNESDSLNCFEKEYSETEERTSETGLFFEKIGSNLCRLYLAGLTYSDIMLKTVNQMFVSTANSVHGDVQGLERKIDAFKRCCQTRELPYKIQDIRYYIDEQKRLGYPPISHSDVYREEYGSAYGVVTKEFQVYFDVFRKIDLLMRQKPFVIVAIDGNAGAGKSTFADLLSRIYQCNIIRMDHFFLPAELRTELRMSESGGNVDYDRFKKDVLSGILNNNSFLYRKYDCAKQRLGCQVRVAPKRLTIVEGVYSMHPTLIEKYTLKVFLKITPLEQKKRILKRDGAFKLKRYMDEWVPLENRYFCKDKIEAKSDLVYEY